jgi:small conductance mechanosensitive channel
MRLFPLLPLLLVASTAAATVVLPAGEDASTTRAATQLVQDIPPLPDPASVPSDVDEAELAIMLRPLEVELLEDVAAVWLDRLKAQVEATSALRLASRSSDGDAKAELAAAATTAGLERDALAGRVMVVLSALHEKGGDASRAEAYVKAVQKDDLELSDVWELWPTIKSWLLAAEGGVALGLNLLWFFLVLVAAIIVSRILRRIARKAVTGIRGASHLLRDFLAGLVYKVALLVGIVIAISFLGVNIAPLVAAIGAAGLVVGLALQGTLSNFASGLLILMYRPFDVGDVVKVAGGVSGKVEALNLVSTTILTFDNQRILVPNNNVWGETITNQTGLATRRVDMTFGVGYDDDLDVVMNELAAVCAEHPLVLADPPPLIKVVSHDDSSVGVTCRPWVKTDDYWGVYWDFHKLVKQRFDAAGISIPFPQRDLHLPGGLAVGGKTNDD